MTEAIYLEVTEKAEAARKAKRRVSVSGMLKILGVSRSGYHAWPKHVPSKEWYCSNHIVYNSVICFLFF